MSSSSEDNELVRFARNPVGWVIGGATAIAGVSLAVLLDPTGTVATIVLSLINQAGLIFTASSITGFTLAPEIPWIPEREVQIIAIASGIVVVGKVIDTVWDNLKERLNDD